MVIIVRYAEIGLKGNNRAEFEKQLCKNIVVCLTENDISYARIQRFSGRILLDVETDEAQHAIVELRRVFGIASVSYGISAGSSVDIALSLALPLMKKGSFRVSCQRVDKTFPMSSLDFCKALGEKIVQAIGNAVNLTSPDTTISCEIINKQIYVLKETAQGAGGLPVHSSGKVAVLIRKKEDALAAILMLKRGCTIVVYTDLGTTKIPTSETQDISWIQRWSYGCQITFFPEHLFATDSRVQGFVVPDTIDNLKDYDIQGLVLRPLAGLTSEEVKIAVQKYS